MTDPVLMNEEGDIVSLSGEVLGGQPGNGGATIALGTPYLRMRYVWGPGDGLGGVYELLAQYDSADTPWYVAQDAQGDVVSMMERVGTSGAHVVAQWTYSPYGVVLTSETFASASGASVPSMVFGHKGLATDRLDRPLDFWDSSGQNLFDTQRLEPGADTLVYANNRTLLPRLGRWLQSDPNASGLIVLDTLGFHGERMHPAIGSMSLAARLRDGLALGQYVSGDPIGQGDPTGLLGLPVLAAGVGFAAGLLLPDPGDIISGMLESAVTEYAARQEWDVMWASEWSLSDDDHSRTDNTWVGFALARGVRDAFDISLGEYSIQPWDYVAGSGSKNSKSTISTGLGAATYSKIIYAGPYRATIFNHPTGRRSMVAVDPSAVMREVRVDPSKSYSTHLRHANDQFKAPPDWVWHHHSWKRGVMQLIPKSLHDAIKPHSGVVNW